MIRRFLLPVVLAGSLLTSGCYTLNMQVDSAYPVLVNTSQKKTGYFKQEERVLYFAWGLVNTNPGVVNDMMRPYKTKTVRSVNVSTEFDFIGTLTMVVTFGIVGSRVVRVEGHTD